MKWIVSHQSALEFWRKASAKDALAGKRSRAINPSDKLLRINELKDMNYWNLARPLHVLVGSDNARNASPNLRCHIASGKFPGGSFIRMASGLIVCSPELCFLQMAGKLPLVDLVALGYEFCGSYRLDASERGFRDDRPLTSVAGLSSYAARAAGLKGRKNALRALRFIADGAASPMETVLTMLLTLPHRLGGYGLPLPRLNYPIDMPAGAGKEAGTTKAAGRTAGKSMERSAWKPAGEPMGRSAGKSAWEPMGRAAVSPAGKSTERSGGSAQYYGDLYWPEKRVDVEYDSDAYHTGPDRIAKDAMRRNALTSASVTPVTVSRAQITDAAKFREFAEILAGLLGKRIQYPKNGFASRHNQLRRQILPRANRL